MTSAPSCTQRKKWTENETLKLLTFIFQGVQGRAQRQVISWLGQINQSG